MESHTFKISLVFYYSLLITKKCKKTRHVIPNESYAIQRIFIIYNFIYLTTTFGAYVQLQHLVFLYNQKI